MTSPIRQQYLAIKRQYPDVLLFFRLGDFYETFEEDAKTAARVLGKRPGAVRTAAYRGLRGLAEQLERSGSPADWRDGPRSARRASGSGVTQRPSAALKDMR